MKLLNATLKVRGQAGTRNTKDTQENLKVFSLCILRDCFFSNLV